MKEQIEKPDGGFVLVPAWAMVAAWQGGRMGDLKPVDLRAWLASFEVVARRCKARKGLCAAYRVEEFMAITGCARRTVLESLARLRACGLVDVRRSGVVHGGTLAELTFGDSAVVRDAMDLVVNQRRRVPVPRRVVRMLAVCDSPSLIATAFGHLLRCLYLRGRMCSSGGLCKSSWVAEVFGISDRSVKRGRAELLRLGLLLRSPTRQGVLNRWGQGLRWNLHWQAAGADSVTRVARVSPPRAVKHARVSPPRRTGISLSGSENQQPGGGRRHGACGRSSRGVGGLGRLGHVQAEELANIDSLRGLFVRAVRGGMVRACEADALKFAGAAVHARRVGTRNVAGLFATVVRRGLWSHVSHEDEDRARRVAATLLPRRTRPLVGNERAGRRSVPAATVTAEERERIRKLIAESLGCGGMYHVEHAGQTPVEP